MNYVDLELLTINVTISIGGPETSGSIIEKLENDLIGTISGVYYNIVELSYDEDEFPEGWKKDRQVILDFLRKV